MVQKEKKKVALYCRVSTAEQSCERQEKDLMAWAERSHYEVVAVFKETASGSKDSRAERKQVMELARQKYIDSILVTELSRWGRSTVDLLSSLQELHGWGVSLMALNGVQFDLSSPHSKVMTTIFASISEFERDLIRERVKSGIAVAQANGKHIGRKEGDFRKTDKIALSVLSLLHEGQSYRQIAGKHNISKTTVVQMAKRFQEGYYDNQIRKSSKFEYLLGSKEQRSSVFLKK